MFAGKAGALGKLLDSPTNIRLGLKGLPGTNYRPRLQAKATTKILAIKTGTSVDPTYLTHLPCPCLCREGDI